MCSVEFMVTSRIYQKTMEEAAKKLDREQAKVSYFLSKSAEELRQTTEQEKLSEWFDTETRKINAALGKTKVAAAAYGVVVDVLFGQWGQAHVDLAGAASAARRQQAAAGNMRELDIDNVKRARDKKFASSSMLDWAFDITTAFAQGVAMEAKINKEPWDGYAFGIPVGGIFGMEVGPQDTRKRVPTAAPGFGQSDFTKTPAYRMTQMATTPILQSISKMPGRWDPSLTGPILGWNPIF